MTSRLTALAESLEELVTPSLDHTLQDTELRVFRVQVVAGQVYRAYAAALEALEALPGWASEDEAARLHHWRLSQDALAQAEELADALLGKEETG